MADKITSREPTKEMIGIGLVAGAPVRQARAIWQAMHDAAPEVPTAAKPVALWQYRHRNEPADAEWQEIKPRNPQVQTLEQAVEEVRGYIDSAGKPYYIVRVLYEAPSNADAALRDCERQRKINRELFEGMNDQLLAEIARLREKLAKREKP